ncbi:hypothetical protein BDQ17DRAFT_1025768 [Cyathus striatus]|nr:hypothetical protein BDQ17DRAFT_1025768 [Cyathus striatus]
MPGGSQRSSSSSSSSSHSRSSKCALCDSSSNVSDSSSSKHRISTKCHDCGYKTSHKSRRRDSPSRSESSDRDMQVTLSNRDDMVAVSRSLGEIQSVFGSTTRMEDWQSRLITLLERGKITADEMIAILREMKDSNNDGKKRGRRHRSMTLIRNTPPSQAHLFVAFL